MRVVSLESPWKGHQPIYVLNFYFWSWIFEKTSKFWAASCKNEYNLLLVRITVCIESCLPIGWHIFIWWKNPPKSYSILVWIAEWWNSLPSSRNPNNIWYLFHIFGARFGEKDRGLSTCKPQIFSTEIKKSKTYSGWCPFQGLSNGTTLMKIQSGRTVPLKCPWIQRSYRFKSRQTFLPFLLRTTEYPNQICWMILSLERHGVWEIRSFSYK